MKPEGKGTRALAMQIRAELAAPGATAAVVAANHGISRRTLYRLLDSLTASKEPERSIEQVSPASPFISEADAVKIIVDRMAAGGWCETEHGYYRKLWRVSNLKMRDWVIEASTRVRASIDPHYLSALFVDSVRHLRYLAARAEREKKTGLAIEATSRAAMLIATVSRANHVRSVGASEQRLDTTEKLIAAGWTPPAPDGLPMPTVDDPNEGSEDGKA